MERTDYTVIVTRPISQSAALLTQLIEAGFNALAFPTIRVQIANPTPEIVEELDRLRAGDYSWLILTSFNAVQALQTLLADTGTDQLPKDLKIAAQGKRTAEVVKELIGVTPDFVPSKAVSGVFADELVAAGVAGLSVLIPGSSSSSAVVANKLSSAGAKVRVLAIYDTLQVDAKKTAVQELLTLDPSKAIVTLFSPSALKGLLAAAPEAREFLRKAMIVSIGPVTSAAVEEAGYRVAAEAGEQSDAGLLAAIGGLKGA